MSLPEMPLPIPEHGGRLQRAAREYGIPAGHWLDLSTGINPFGWTVPPIDTQCFLRLPETDDGLETAASEYYGSSDLLPMAGSQEAIRELPRTRNRRFGRSRVAVISPGYEEHRYHWQLNGHRVKLLPVEQIESVLDQIDCLVVINPCNPSAVRFTAATLTGWHQRLAARNGWLIVDEAFIDPDPQQSMIRPEMPPGLIVLRSLGKFFGLAGLRVGFLFADKQVRIPLSRTIGPWSIATPSRWLATQALEDFGWQRRTRELLASSRRRLVLLLEEKLAKPTASTELFVTLQIDTARALAHQLAQNAILVRHFEQERCLRFGLPGIEDQWRQLTNALSGIDLLKDRERGL